MMKRLILVAAFLLITVSVADARGITDIDEDMYMNYLVRLADPVQGIGRRRTFEERQEAAKYIYDEFSNLGLEVEYHNFSFFTETNGNWWNGSNVIATHKGELDKTHIVFGHYDSVAAGPGADDNAAGVAGVMCAAEYLSNFNFNYTIKFIAFDCEESYDRNETHGITYAFGSRAYRDMLVDTGEIYNLESAINLDMIGYTGGDPLFQSYVRFRDSPSYPANTLYNHFVSTQENLGGVVVDRNHGYTSASDHRWFVSYCDTVFIQESNFPENPHYHKSTDRIEYMDIPYAVDVTRLVTATIFYMAEPHPVTFDIPMIAIFIFLFVVVVAFFYFRKNVYIGPVGYVKGKLSFFSRFIKSWLKPTPQMIIGATIFCVICGLIIYFW